MAVADTRIMVAGTQTAVADTHMMVADIHRKVLAGQERTPAHHSVSATYYPPETEH